MSPPPPCWRHVSINAKNTWLTGDRRGFREHDHRIIHWKLPESPTATRARINNAAHLHNVWRHIREGQESGAVIWSIAAAENWIDHSQIAPGKTADGASLAIEHAMQDRP